MVLAELQQSICALRGEVAGIKASIQVGLHNEESYRNALLKNLPVPVPLAASKTTDSATREVIVIGVPEDMADLQTFAANSAKDLGCVPPTGALRLGRPGPKRRLIKLSFPDHAEATAYHLASVKAGRENRTTLRTCPGLPSDFCDICKGLAKLFVNILSCLEQRKAFLCTHHLEFSSCVGVRVRKP
ncbi:Hypothetical predicted protein [Octopus vulgaris]|uniref:Uncharacterized protein n=1 Tax=Octopus vulgaris TaxID=6645 RepID=A0AA36BZP0_OCTVU|nr:Hypothetical predicted protein [Octopus vulgaris]